MSSVLLGQADANGKVTLGGVEVPGALVLSLGKQASSGILIIDQGRVFYLPSSATDIQTTLEKVSQALDKIGSILTAIGGGMSGPSTAPPPTLATDVAALNAIKGEIDTLKGALK